MLGARHQWRCVRPCRPRMRNASRRWLLLWRHSDCAWRYDAMIDDLVAKDVAWTSLAPKGEGWFRLSEVSPRAPAAQSQSLGRKFSDYFPGRADGQQEHVRTQWRPQTITAPFRPTTSPTLGVRRAGWQTPCLTSRSSWCSCARLMCRWRPWKPRQERWRARAGRFNLPEPHVRNSRPRGVSCLQPTPRCSASSWTKPLKAFRDARSPRAHMRTWRSQ